MVRRFPITFDDERPVDEVLVAVAPMDAFTGLIVPHNVDARIEGLPDRPIRNLSGLLVFLKPKPNEAEPTATVPDQEKYRIHVSAETAGYFDPELAEFEPPKDDDESDPRTRLRLDVPLLRLPTFPFTEETTLVSGVVVRGEEAVTGARIWAKLPAGVVPGNVDSPIFFETKSYSRGAFALALRLPAWEDNPDSLVTIVLHVKEDGHPEFKQEIQVKEHQRHVFEEPIDISGTTSPLLLIR